jgi:hypothetical protein
MHRPLLAALAGIPYGLALNEAAAHSPAVQRRVRTNTSPIRFVSSGTSPG